MEGPHGLTFTWWGCCGLCLWHKPTELAHSFLFCSCVYFCLYGPFNCFSFHKFSRQLSALWLCSSGFISALLVLSTIYLFMKVFFSPDIILCGWMGLKHQLTNQLTFMEEEEEERSVVRRKHWYIHRIKVAEKWEVNIVAKLLIGRRREKYLPSRRGLSPRRTRETRHRHTWWQFLSYRQWLHTFTTSPPLSSGLYSH